MMSKFGNWFDKHENAWWIFPLCLVSVILIGLICAILGAVLATYIWEGFWIIPILYFIALIILFGCAFGGCG